VSPERLERAEAMTEERMRGQYGRTLEDELATIMRAAGAPDDPESVSLYRDSQLRAWQEATIVQADVISCLEALHRAHVRLGLVSNCSHLTRPLLERWQLGRYFHAMALSCEVGCAKPDPRILATAVHAMDANPEDGLLVDDRAEYVSAAAAIGLDGCQIVRGRSPEMNDHRVISDLREICPAGWSAITLAERSGPATGPSCQVK
jgi:HAD superfamily hydrolase (TIGR01509 family)